ncbi:pilus assembly protein PilM [Candidatus Riflebacteria bacterium]
MDIKNLVKNLNFKDLNNYIMDGIGNIVQKMNPPSILPLIDIGSHNCKILKGKYQLDGKWNLDLYREIPAPEEMVMSHLLPQYHYDNTNFRLILSFFRDEYLKKESYIQLVLPDSAFNINVMKVSNVLMRESPINAIRKELALVLPFKINQYIINYFVLDQQELFTEVVALSYLRNNLRDLVRLFQAEGLFPLRIECSIFNVINSFKFFLENEEQEDENIAILHFSHESNLLTIFKNGKLMSLQRLGLGSDFLINALQKGLKINRKKAVESLYESHILSAEYTKEQEQNPYFQAIREPLLKQLEAIFDFFEEYLSRSREEKLDKILISGGLANMKNFHFLLENNFKIPVYRLSDIVKVQQANEVVEANLINSASPLLGMLVA